MALYRRRQSDDTGLVDTDTQLVGGAQHAVRHVAVRLAGTDGKSAREHSTGQGDDNPGTFNGIGGTADDAAALGPLRNVFGVSFCVVPGANVNPTPVDDFAVLLRLGN